MIKGMNDYYNNKILNTTSLHNYIDNVIFDIPYIYPFYISIIYSKIYNYYCMNQKQSSKNYSYTHPILSNKSDSSFKIQHQL
jgi:hypothetical protein